ncbi:MAG: cysteine desulfurase [Hellea sp.]|nr:cysteine desulfurase [Hellea sp.]
MTKRIYFDHNSTSPARPEVIEAVGYAMTVIGNPSAPHAHGRAARGLISDAREALAVKLGLCAQDIIFTGSGTEGNNTAVMSAVSGGCKRLLISSLDHPASQSAAERSGATIDFIPALKSGLMDMNWLETELKNWNEADGRPFVSMPAANSETGVIQDYERAIEMTKDAGGLILIDAVQTLGKIDFMCLPDYLSVSAHKIGGPQGVGALYVSSDAPFTAYLTGGGQEQRRRAGTMNVAGIYGFGAAVKEAHSLSDINKIRDYIEVILADMEPGLTIFGKDVTRLPNTSFFALPDTSSMTLMMALDLEGISVSRGMACSSGKTGASKALTAMNCQDQAPEGAIRLSLGYNSTLEEAEIFLNSWAKIRNIDRTKLKVAS